MDKVLGRILLFILCLMIFLKTKSIYFCNKSQTNYLYVFSLFLFFCWGVCVSLFLKTCCTFSFLGVVLKYTVSYFDQIIILKVRSLNKSRVCMRKKEISFKRSCFFFFSLVTFGRKYYPEFYQHFGVNTFFQSHNLKFHVLGVAGQIIISIKIGKNFYQLIYLRLIYWPLTILVFFTDQRLSYKDVILNYFQVWVFIEDSIFH